MLIKKVPVAARRALITKRRCEVKTREDVEKLKKDWEWDPCWDIETTEGFEKYRDELVAFQETKRKEWANQKEQNRLKECLQCRVFCSGARKTMQDAVNEFLKTPNIAVVQVLQSESETNITITVFYKEV